MRFLSRVSNPSLSQPQQADKGRPLANNSPHLGADMGFMVHIVCWENKWFLGYVLPILWFVDPPKYLNPIRYGNRMQQGAKGWDAALPRHFHHKKDCRVRAVGLGWLRVLGFQRLIGWE